MAIDLSIDEPAVGMGQAESGESLSDKAERCRRLAAGISDRQAADVLRGMALQYEENAARKIGG